MCFLSRKRTIWFVFDDLSVLNSQTNPNLGKKLSFFEEYTLLSSSRMLSAFYQDVVFEKIFCLPRFRRYFFQLSIALMFEGHSFQVVGFWQHSFNWGNSSPMEPWGGTPSLSWQRLLRMQDVEPCNTSYQIGVRITPTWRIIPVTKWLITMVIISPLRIGLAPFQMA